MFYTLGRGDGRLYAIDPDVGKIDWRFESFNPQLPEDPDGGGELVSSPVIGADGTIYFGSRGIGPCETNDFFDAVNPDSTLQWRFPRGTDGACFDSVHLVSVIEGKQQYKCGTLSSARATAMKCDLLFPESLFLSKK